jgi:hypothetical protein
MASPQTLQERALDQACQTVLFMALELSDKKWKLALTRQSYLFQTYRRK